MIKYPYTVKRVSLLVNQKFISVNEHQELTRRCKPEKGDILLSKCGTVGICQVVRKEIDFSIFVGLALIKPNKLVLSDYIELLLNTDTYRKRMNL